MADIEAGELAVFILNASGRVATWNDRCARMFAREAGDVLRRSFGDLLDPATRPQFNALLEQLQHGQPIQPDVRWRIRHPGGAAAANLHFWPQCSRSGSLLGCAVMATPDEGDAGLVARLPLSTFRDAIAAPLYVIDQQGQMVLWNRHVEHATELSPAELSGLHVLELFAENERAHVAQKIQQVFEEGNDVQVEASLRARGGGSTPYLFTGARLLCGRTHFLCGIGIDLTARRAQEAMLRLRERALHATNNAIVITGSVGHDHPIEYVNPAFERITGYSAAEVVGRDARFMAAPGMDEGPRAQLRQAIAAQRPLQVVLRNLRKNGELFWNELSITPVADEGGQVSHFIGVINDVTATKQRTAHLEHAVNHDALTGLANRILLWDRLDQAIHQAQRNKSLVATVLLDLNDFKHINDSMGHEVGDEVLIMVAKRLLASVREVDTVARLAGDEFVLVLTDQPSLRFTARMIERLRLAMTRPLAFDSRELAVGASMGVSIFPHDGNNVTALVHAADVAMYHAKGNASNNVQFFSADMRSSTEARQQLEQSLRQAVERDEMIVYFQPKQCIKSGLICGIEALLRWRHPLRGILLPDAFLKAAEDNGLIVPIGERVLDRVCQLLHELPGRGWPTLPVSFNASYREFSQDNFMAGVERALARYQVAPVNLQIECTEEQLMRNPHLGAQLGQQMQALGVRLVVDEFGAGPSNLAFLEKLPISSLNLSRECVRDIGAEGEHGKLTKTLIDIGHNLGWPVIAEGVETRAQADFLQSQGCDELQGSYFSAPLAASALDQLLAASTGAAP